MPRKRTTMTIRVLHIIERLSLGGASQSLLGIIRHSESDTTHHILISLLSPDRQALKQAVDLGIDIEHPGQSNLLDQIARADIVQIHFWNSLNFIAFSSFSGLRRGLFFGATSRVTMPLNALHRSWLNIATRSSPLRPTPPNFRFSKKLPSAKSPRQSSIRRTSKSWMASYPISNQTSRLFTLARSTL